MASGHALEPKEEAHAAFERFRALAPAMAADRGAIAEQFQKWAGRRGSGRSVWRRLWKVATRPQRTEAFSVD